MIHPARIAMLNEAEVRPGRYVLYWMQASQRAHHNDALEYAIEQANALDRPVVVGFGLMDDYPEANERHYAFMLEGLRDVEAGLRERGIRFVVRHGSPERVAMELARNAAMVVCDRGYLRHQQRWRDVVADHAGRRVVQVESDVVVPVELASEKAEYAARTIRPKIHRLWDEHFKLPRPLTPRHSSLGLRIASDFDLSNIPAILATLRIDRSVTPTRRFIGGTTEAHRLLERFLRERLDGYADGRNEPGEPNTSTLAAYLHFGQISPVEIASKVYGHTAAAQTGRDAFLEELIVRRELAVNFVYHSPRYDEYAGLPRWARQTLEQHRPDPRPYVYSRRDLEEAHTHDPLWNAAQMEMVHSGYMHNTMRMYWGKKILEWKADPAEAYADTLYLNNKYFLCGRDPNAYANVGWIFGLHDRPWARRPIFGTVRYMNAAGLRRKFDMDAYLRFVQGLQS